MKPLIESIRRGIGHYEFMCRFIGQVTYHIEAGERQYKMTIRHKWLIRVLSFA